MRKKVFMMNSKILIVLLSLFALFFVKCSEPGNSKLKLVNKPDVHNMPVVQPREQNKVYEVFKNDPYIDRSPLPEFTEEEKQYGFMLFARPIEKAVYKNYHPKGYERINKLSGFATIGEYEPLTFSVCPLRDMKNFRVLVSDLQSGKDIIEKENIDLRLVTNWNLRYPKYTSPDTYREVPELLEKVTVNSFKKGENQRYWITVHVPENAEAGIYSGNVTLFDDSSNKAVQVPVQFRVLPYKLIKDPQKHFTSFMLPYSHLYRGFEPDSSLVVKAIAADFSNMIKYGYDLFPDFYLRSGNGKNGEAEFYIKPEDEMMIDKAMEVGLKGKIILVGGWNYFMDRYHPECKPAGGHGKLTQYPPATSKMFPALTKAVKKFTTECKNKGWHDLIFFVYDEPRGDNAEFMSRVYDTFKKGGAETLLSNDPTSSYAHFYLDKNCVDIWLSQPFDIPYDKVVADKNHEYWSYPNHNAGEFKNRLYQQKGGRMTYGFGLWKSGYNTLMPWAWRWSVKGNHNFDQFDYLYTGAYASGCGMRLDEQANFIPAIYWECFREGYDDGRYLYTLQQTMAERERSDDTNCLKLVTQGHQLLDNLWRIIEPKKKYLSVDFIDDKSFNNIRWQIASLTMDLMKYDPVSSVTAPSVMANTTLNSNISDEMKFLNEAKEAGAVKCYDMTEDKFGSWKASRDKELSFNTEEEVKAIVMNVTVDKKHDGANSTNKHPVGSPLIRYNLKSKDTDVNAYDYLFFKVKFESNRDNVTTDAAAYGFTPVKIVFRKEKGETSVVLNLGGNENIWQTIQIPVTQEMKGTKDIAILVNEADYPNQTNIKFTIPEIGLYKFRSPYIKRIVVSSPVLTSDNKLVVKLDGFEFEKGMKEGYSTNVILKDKNEKIITKSVAPLTKDYYAVLDVYNLSPGTYSLIVELCDKNGSVNSTGSVPVNVINGYINY